MVEEERSRASGVGETQVEEVQSYDEGVPIISITNGDDRSYSAKDFRRFFWGSGSFPDPDADVEFPQSWQIETVKRIANARLGLNPYQPVISYSGRQVERRRRVESTRLQMRTSRNW